jgi:hypothetical protein
MKLADSKELVLENKRETVSVFKFLMGKLRAA